MQGLGVTPTPTPRGALLAPTCASLLARIVTSVTALGEGYDIGCMSGVTVLLQHELGLTSLQVGVLVGILNFAIMAGAPLGASLSDVFGRKTALGATYVLLITGSIVMAVAADLPTLIVGRVIMGMGLGAGYTSVTSYITEVSPKHLRGVYVSLEDLFVIVGIFMGFLFNFLLSGPGYGWRWMLGLGAVAPLVALLLLAHPQMLESPRWRMLQGDSDRAERDLAVLVGQKEASGMIKDWGTNYPVASWGEIISPKGTWRKQSLLLSVAFLFLSSCSGTVTFTAYLGYILKQDLPIHRVFELTAWLGIMRITVQTFSTFVLVNNVGRRPLLLISMSGMAFGLFWASGAYFLREAVELKFAAILTFYAAAAVGMGPLSHVYPTEIVPSDVRSKGYSLGLICGRVFAGSTNMVFPSFVACCGLHLVFALFGIINLVGLVIIANYAPETQGISLEEVEHLFKQKKDEESLQVSS